MVSPMQCSPVIPKVPAEEVASEMVKQGEIGLVSCVFGCGPPRPVTHMTNTATHVSPRWMCRPCNGARKAIEGQCNKDPQLKASLIKLKK